MTGLGVPHSIKALSYRKLRGAVSVASDGRSGSRPECCRWRRSFEKPIVEIDGDYAHGAQHGHERRDEKIHEARLDLFVIVLWTEIVVSPELAGNADERRLRYFE